MTDVTGPRLPAAFLKLIYRLDFTPVRIRTRAELTATLQAVGVRDESWVDKLWAEYVRGESLLARDPSPEGGVLRFLRTVTLRIVRMREESGHLVIEVLWESIEHPDGTVTRRPYGNTVSEKMLWDETNPMKAVKRCLREELGVRITTRLRRLLRHPVLKLITTIFGLVREPLSDLKGELYKKEFDQKRPGVTTYNFLFHWLWEMPELFWKEEYRETHDEKTMVFRWIRSQAFDRGLEKRAAE